MMNRNKNLVGLRLLIPCLLAGLIFSGGMAQAALSKNQQRRIQQSNKFFGRDQVVRFKIEISEEGISALREYRYVRGRNQVRPKVKATVRAGDQVFKDVAIHLKGAVGSFRSIDDKPALTLNFDKFVDGQEFQGMDKIYLNNSVQDDTYLNEKLSREIFNRAGVSVPRASHALVELNGRDLGLYVLVEGFDKRFLRHHFKDVSGNLYDGGFATDITEDLSLNSGDNPEDRTKLKELIAATKEENVERRSAALENALDMDRFVTHIALDALLCNWDGYATVSNNYRIYHDRDTNKMVFIPHGLDQLFQDPQSSIYPWYNSSVAKAFMELPDGPDRYFAKVDSLVPEVLDGETLLGRVDEIAAVLQKALSDRGGREADELRMAVDGLKDNIAERFDVLDNQLSGQERTIDFGQDRVAELVAWERDNRFAELSFSDTEVDGTPLLELHASQGSAWGAWASKVWLTKGQYRLEGRFSCREVLPDHGDSKRGGAFVQVSGERVRSQSPKRHQGNTDWKAVSQEFTVELPFAEVTVSCELRAREGAASFERKSFRLVQIIN